MRAPPANVQETTAQIIAAGIAHRILVESYMWHLPNDPSGCLFWVEVVRINREEVTALMVQYPPRGLVQAIRAMPGEAFAVSGRPPLSADQQDLINRLAKAWEQSETTTA